ncbi:MAG TPA: hypothetical protein P5121_28730 [Caldilineaceae bacterium]|nr:hypothetical protein [Caldilineaceae bacterium]
MARHKFHGDANRFDVMAAFIYDNFGKSVHYIADVAGGQGMLSRILNKKYNYSAEVIDPRGYTLTGVGNRQCYYHHDLAAFYDLIVGLHLDEAMREVALSALTVPTVMVPCCNFWSDDKLGSKELVDEIERYLLRNGVLVERHELPIKPPKNIALLTTPTADSAGATGEFDEPVLQKLSHQSSVSS